uniref:Portal protein n=1 Tax=viral metagenome TaxID=1070528 RepID=A0A6M3JAY9_9ZZZZ
MPYNLDPNQTALSSTQDFGYKYPEGLDLRPGSSLHQDLLTKIIQRARESHNEISKKYSSWRSVDETLTAYISTDDAEEMLKKADSRKPISIVVPFSYATLETLLTYFVAAFLDSPIFKYEGTSPEDVLGAILMEKVVDQNVARAKVALNLHTMWRDSFAYGIGAVSPGWTKEWGYRTRFVDQGFFSSIFSRFVNEGKRRVQEETIIYEGNKLSNIDPYLYLPDPNVPAHEPQRGEFNGWIDPSNIMALLSEEAESDGDIFNVQYLKGIGNGRSLFNTGNSGRYSKTGDTTSMAPSTTTPIDKIHMYVNLIPQEWKLGQSKRPEKWLFTVGADKIIIRAKKLGLNHNRYPTVVGAPDFDGYSVTPLSRMETIYGLQTTLDWLFNSHIANVRKAINDMLVVDPSLININDLKDPQPGKLVRLRRSAWGRDVKGAVQQLAVVDVTKQHIQDSAYVVDLMQKCSAAVDSVMGVIDRRGERVSATESRDVNSNALSRLAKAARVTSIQAMYDIGYMFASHTQQLMSKELWVDTTGRWAETLEADYGQRMEKGKIKVMPWDLSVDYDLTIKDGSVMSGDAQVWSQVFQVIASNPALLGAFDLPRIFKHIARLMGAKDVDEFIIKGGMPPAQMSMVPDALAIAEKQAGNIVPVGGAA